jgi:hypothetical protein
LSKREADSRQLPQRCRFRATRLAISSTSLCVTSRRKPQNAIAKPLASRVRNGSHAPVLLEVRRFGWGRNVRF